MKIFEQGTDYYRRAYFGWQDKHTALVGVKMGYMDSANDLVDIALNRDGETDIKTLDTYIFPIVFLYRNSIEVSIKAIYFRAYDELPPGGHNLIVLWDKLTENVLTRLDENILENLIKGFNKEYDISDDKNRTLKNIRGMFLEFDKLGDKNADVFRYLMNKEGVLYFTKSEYVDYDNLKMSMNYLYDILDMLYNAIDEYYEDYTS